MPQWAMGLVSLVITLLFVLGIFALAASLYGAWVREFYAKRDRLQTLFGDPKRKEDQRQRLRQSRLWPADWRNVAITFINPKSDPPLHCADAFSATS